jgi:hypothetical protein
LLAALILQREDQPLALIAEVERVRAMMRDLGMRRLRMERKKRYEFIAIVVMRFHGGLTPIEMDRVRRLHAIHEQMKWHHWWLTGPDDYPACALLSGQDRSPEDIAARANAIYDGLSQRGSAWRGDPLQTASNVLALSLLEPNELVDRFATLLKKFDRDGPIRMSRDEYDEVAVLCFLAQPCDLIVETVTGYARTMYARLRWPDSTRTFGLATNLAFAHLLGNDPELGALADLKVLLDMQELLIAREGAEA